MNGERTIRRYGIAVIQDALQYGQYQAKLDRNDRTFEPPIYVREDVSRIHRDTYGRNSDSLRPGAGLSTAQMTGDGPDRMGGSHHHDGSSVLSGEVTIIMSHGNTVPNGSGVALGH